MISNCNSQKKFLLLFSFFLHSLFGQTTPIKLLNTKDGLSNNSVNAINQDNNGFIWFGTYDGLNRYDGNEFKIYRNIIGDPHSLKGNSINCIEKDTNNNLWIGTSNGTYILNSGTGEFSPLYCKKQQNKPALPLSDIIYTIKRIKNNTLLIGSQTNGLIIVESKMHIGKKIPLIISGSKKYDYYVSAIEMAPGKNYCYVFVDKIGLCYYNFSSRNLSVANRRILQANCLLETSKGLLFGTDNGLCLLNKNSMSKQYLLPHTIITKLIKDKQNRLWIGTDGAGIFLMKDNKINAFTVKDGSSLTKSKAIQDIFEDTDGNIWYGTLRGGISMLANRESNFNHILFTDKTKNDPAYNFILSFCEDKNNNLWIGTDGAGLRYWNRKTNTYHHYSSSADGKMKLSSNYITNITTDEHGNIWTSTWGGGINKIDSDKNAIKQYRCFNPVTKSYEENIWLIFVDSKKRIWASSLRAGHLYQYDKANDNFKLFNKKALDLLCVTEATNGTFWAGSYSQLYHLNPQTKSITSLPIEYPVRSICTAANNNLWIGTAEGGLLLYNTKKETFKRFTTKEGLPSNTVLRIIKDQNGSLWLSTYNGLSYFNPKQGTFRNYTMTDGLQSNQFSYNAGLMLSTGEVAFGGINGFNIFWPKAIKDNPSSNSTVITNLLINNQSTEQKNSYVAKSDTKGIQELHLPYDQTNLSINFASLDYNNSDKIMYAYYLEGWDNSWNYGKNHTANYSRLMEGTYTFKVKTTKYGQWTTPLALLTVIVSPPWYRTFWAYGFYMIIIVSLVTIYIRYNNYKQRLHYEIELAKLESKKEKEIAERQLTAFTYISHEFRTPLSLIINPVKQSIQNNKEGLPIQQHLTVAHRNARRLLSLVDQLLLFREAENSIQNLKISSFNIQTLCKEVFKCFEYLVKEKKIEYKLIMPENPPVIYGDYEKLEITLFNLLSNAFKYTPDKGSITLQVQHNDTEVLISVTDSGTGIEEEKITHIFDQFYRIPSKSSHNIGFGIGLYITKQFIEKHQGNIICSSTHGKGTSFTITLKKGYEHLPDLPLYIQTEPSVRMIDELLTDELSINEHNDRFLTTGNGILTDQKAIVIIENDEEMRKYLIELFTEKYLVYSASNGAAGLDIVKKVLPDIVLSDINMDLMDGLSLCQSIKQTDELSHIPVILLTATTDAEVQLQGIKIGVDDYVTKPFENNILLAKVDTLLKNRNQLRKYFLDNITLKQNNQKVSVEYSGFLNRCFEIIEANLDKENFTIKEFSKEIGMSHSSLYKKIKLISGQTINAFIRSVRLRKAAVLLLTENVTVAEAGIRVGIGDPRYFRRQFSLLFGMSPSDYIRKYRYSFNKELNVIQNDIS